MNGLQDWLLAAGGAPVGGAEARDSLGPFVRDLAGVTLAGSRTETAASVLRYLDSTAGPGSAPVIGTERTVDPVSAAFANGSSAQALDFDDIAPSCVSHLSAVMVPAVHALVPEYGAARALDGLLAGFKVVDRLAEAFTHEVYDRGLQPTHTMGSIGATVALLHALDAPEQVRAAAFGLLATQMIGLRSHTGTRYKAVQAGMVSAASVRSVLLAREGVTSGGDAVDVMMRLIGLTDDDLAALTRPGDLRPVPLAAKFYPTCGAAHTAIEATQTVRAQLRPTDPLDVRLVVTSPPRVMVALTFDRPWTPDEARFSMPYCVATAWLSGQVRPADFTPEAIERAEIRKVMDQVHVRIDDALTPPPTWSGFPAVVTAESGGSSAEAHVERPLGFPERPLSPEQWREKFDVCVGPVLGDEGARRAYEALSGDDAIGRLGTALRSG